MRVEVQLKQPFWSAGSPTNYGWTLDGHSMIGYGIAWDKIKYFHKYGFENVTIIVSTMGESYETNAKEFLEFAKKYKAKHVGRNNTLIYVASKSIFRLAKVNHSPRLQNIAELYGGTVL